jgi:hypothetical protein
MDLFENILRMVVVKFAGLKRRVEKKKAIAFTEKETPQLLSAYNLFGQNNQLGFHRQPFKGWDVWRLLEKFQPNYIVEAGSGTTSAVFALWANINGARYVCYEHHSEWAEITENCLRESGLMGRKSPVYVVKAIMDDDDHSNGFEEDIPIEADFVYIDGPPCKLANGKKVPNNDIVRCFNKGGRPKNIIIDGRAATVDLIKAHEAGSLYKFSPSFVYCLRNRSWMRSILSGEHTHFSLIS